MKLRVLSLSLLLAAFVVMLTSCTRDHLYYATSDMATVLVETDWTTSGVHPNGVSVFAYDATDGHLYKRFAPVAASRKCYLKLPEGDYTLVVMNDSPEEFDGRLSFTGADHLSTFEVRGVKDETKSRRLVDYLQTKADVDAQTYCIVEPDTLAVAVVNGLHITPEQMDYYHDPPGKGQTEGTVVEVKVQPRPVISKVNIKAHVKGLKYARGTTLSFLRGLAAGHRLGDGVNTTDQVSQAFILNNRVFDAGSDTDGTITAEFLSFGLVGDGQSDSRYYLDINFVLVNGESYPLTFDITDLIAVDVSISLKLSLNLNLEIELPEVTGNEEGGFNTGVTEWEGELLEIPM